MPEKHICDFFTKVIPTSVQFLKDVWHPRTKYQENDRVYREYKCNASKAVVNDFLSKKSYLASTLSLDEIRDIHFQNSEHALMGRQDDMDISYNAKSDIEEECPHFKSNMADNMSGTSIDKAFTDEYITDEFLDKLLIKPGQRPKRLQEFCRKSKIIYSYLSYHIGDEFIIESRRRLLELQYNNSFFMNGCLCSLLISGSRAEGMSLRGSDTDVMIATWKAREGSENTSANGFIVEYDSLENNVRPGYTLVRYAEVSVSSTFFKNNYLRLAADLKLAYTLSEHGPSMSMSSFGDDIDLVLCVECLSWPAIANDWKCRTRKFEWPSVELVNKIVSKGCHIVPVGSKGVDGVDYGEWRLSFSEAEKTLISTYNHTQFLVYALLKLILKEVIDTQEEIKDLLCSYFMKTTMFWVIEETNSKIWQPRHFMLGFHLSLDRLIQFIIAENCPNYFVPMNNMFIDRFTSKKTKAKLLKVLIDVSHSGFQWVVDSPTLIDLFSCLTQQSSILELRQSEKSKHGFEFFKLILNIIQSTRTLISALSTNYNGLTPVFLKQAIKIPVVEECTISEFCHYVNSDCVAFSNKKSYLMRKLQLDLLLRGCRADLVAGKALLATWLYNQCKYQQSLDVLEFALECTKHRLFHVGSKTITKCTKEYKDIPSSNFIYNLQHVTTFNIIFPVKSTLLLNGMSTAFSFIPEGYKNFNPIMINLFPDTYCHFLKALCYDKIGITERSAKAMADMDTAPFVGSDVEDMTNKSGIMLMKVFEKLLRVQSDSRATTLYEYVNTLSYSELMKILQLDLSGAEYFLRNFEQSGMSLDFMRQMLSIDNC